MCWGWWLVNVHRQASRPRRTALLGRGCAAVVSHETPNRWPSHATQRRCRTSRAHPSLRPLTGGRVGAALKLPSRRCDDAAWRSFVSFERAALGMLLYVFDLYGRGPRTLKGHDLRDRVPPSMTSCAPVMKLDSSLANKARHGRSRSRDLDASSESRGAGVAFRRPWG